MVNKMKKLAQRHYKNAVLASSALAVTAQQAIADVPPEATAAVTAMQTDGLSMANLFWAPVAAITGAFVLFKIFKRGTAKI